MDAFLALTPAALLMVVFRLRRILPAGSVWLASALAVSAVGDIWSTAAGGAWYPSYVWLPVQLGLAFRAVARGRDWAVLCVWLAVLGAYDIASMTGPEVLVTGVGSTAVTWAAIHSGHRLTAPVLWYFGAGSIAYLGMVAASGNGGFMTWWWAYQGCRVLAWLTFADIVRACWMAQRRAVRADDRTDMQLMEVAT